MVQRFASIFTNTKNVLFFVVSHPAEAQVPIFTAQMKHVFKKCQTNTLFFDISNHARAQVPIVTPKIKKNKMGTAGEPPDPADPRHGAWCTTPGTLAPEVRLTLILNTLPQMEICTRLAADKCCALMNFARFEIFYNWTQLLTSCQHNCKQAS